MSSETIGIIGIIFLVILLFSRIWIGAAMMIVGFLGYSYIMSIKSACSVVAQIPFSTTATYAMSAIPLFILMGCILFNSGVGADLYKTAHKWIGQVNGGLAMASVIACAFFAAITGISAPALITMGKVAVPEMRKYKYDDKLATGSIASAGTLSVLIPPSMAFIIYGILTEQSIGLLFIAGILPGILLTSLFLIVIKVITIYRPESGPSGPKTTFKEKIISLKNSWHCVLLFLIILGGIYGGIFTPTEAGAIGTFGAIIITATAKRLTVKALISSLLETAQTTAMVFFLIMGGYILMKFLTISKLPSLLTETIINLPFSPTVVLIGIFILYLLLGMFLDIFSAVIITVPILFPVITGLGFDPIWFGVIVVIMIQIGLVSPPVGLDIFTLGGVIDVPLYTIFKGVLPFFVGMAICIILLIIFPQIVLFLPNMM